MEGFVGEKGVQIGGQAMVVGMVGGFLVVQSSA